VIFHASSPDAFIRLLVPDFEGGGLRSGTLPRAEVDAHSRRTPFFYLMSFIASKVP
jgi:hypothetical protein